MLGPHVRNLCDLNLFAQFIVSWLDSFDFFVENLELYLSFFDVVLRVIDTEIVWVYASFYLINLVELLGHGISHIQFSVQFWEIGIESFEEDWLGIIGWLRLGDEVLQLLEACIIEFVLLPLVKNFVEFLSFQEVNIMFILLVFWLMFIFRNDHDNNTEQSCIGLWLVWRRDNLSYVTFIESRDFI